MSKCINKICHYRCDELLSGCKHYDDIDLCSQLVLLEDIDLETLREENKMIRIKIRKLVHVVSALMNKGNNIELDVILEFLKDE